MYVSCGRSDTVNKLASLSFGGSSYNWNISSGHFAGYGGEGFFRLLYMIFAGTALGYIGRGVLDSAQVGIDVVAATSRLEHARLLSDSWRARGFATIILQLYVIDRDSMDVAQQLLHVDKMFAEAVLAAMMEAQFPFEVVGPIWGLPTPQQRILGQDALSQAIFQGSRTRAFLTENRRQLDFLQLARGECPYVWWHRECHLSRQEFVEGLVRLRVLGFFPADRSIRIPEELYAFGEYFSESSTVRTHRGSQ